MQQKRLIISALSGGGGKTFCSLGLCRAFKNLGNTVLPFKKGPDYIDTAWLSLASQRKAYNLDPFFLSEEELRQHFSYVCSQENNNSSVALIEGNRGLYDGKDIEGSASTAELAYILDTPVVLTVDATKATRTLAAIINGIVNFDKRITIIGLIFNNIASSRHEKIIYDSVNHYCESPILGFIPRFKENPLPERHLGLVLDSENQEKHENILNNLGNTIQKHINVECLLEKLNSLREIPDYIQLQKSKSIQQKSRIGYIKDKAIWFYYTENFEALENEGAELIELSLFNSENWDTIDALYIGGGYPEIYAEEIEKSPLLAKIKTFADSYMPIYAECGGFMLLSRSIHGISSSCAEKKSYKMANIFAIDLEFYEKPQGLGYIEAEVNEENFYFSKENTNNKIKGHEFHYSLSLTPPNNAVFSLDYGCGMGNKQDGVQYKHTFACYTHIYAPANPCWAANFINLAHNFKNHS